MFLRFRRKTRVVDLEKGRDATVKGTIVAEKELKVPHEGTRCIFYDMLSESYGVGARGRGRPMWLPQKAERKCVGFFVDDGSGRVWVRADDESVNASGGTAAAGLVGKKGRQRYSVRMIKDGDLVRVRGRVSTPKGTDPRDTLVLAPGRKGRLDILFLGSTKQRERK